MSARPLDVPMKRPFGIAGGAQRAAANLLVTVELTSGARGYGEGAPFPAFNGETQADALAACEGASGLLCGRDARAIALEARPLPLDSPSAVCAVESAVIDAFTRHEGTSLRAWLGGAERALVSGITITTGSPEEADRDAREHTAFSTLKIKVGGGDVGHDLARVLAVHAARPDARILLDANGGLSVDDAISLARELVARGITPALFEQPIAPGSWEALAEVRSRTGLVIAADESIASPSDVDAAHAGGAADVVNMKIMKSGVFGALAIARRAAELGLARMVGGLVETRLAHGVSACIAAGLGGFSFVDLDTPLFLAEDPFDGGYAQDGERLDLAPITLGHGATPRFSRR